MNRIAAFALGHRKAVLVFWTVAFLVALVFALRIDSVLKGSSDTIRDSPSDKVTQAVNRTFGRGSAFPFPLLLESREIGVGDPRFARAAQALQLALTRQPGIVHVQSYWNSGMPELLGRDGRSALFLVTPDADDFSAADILTAEIRTGAEKAALGADFEVTVTGAVAMFHDLNRDSSSDLLRAERIGIPITLVILLLVFGAPVAAALPLILAFISVVISLAGLYALSHWMPVSVFAQNAVTMIGLGVGVDYALFIISRFREELRLGAPPEKAALNAAVTVGHAVVFSGITVAIGFLALFLVHARFFHSLALGGTMVMAASLAATLSLLPVLLSYFGNLVNWPRTPRSLAAAQHPFGRLWGVWARSIMGHPWLYVVPALVVLALFIAPVFRLQIWNVGAKDLDPQMEARRGAESLEQNFASGWMGPVVVLLESTRSDLWDPASQAAVLAAATRLGADKRVASVEGFPKLLAALGPARSRVGSAADLPAALRPAAASAVSADGKTALIVLIARQPPEHAEVKSLVAELRSAAWPELHDAGIAVQIGGATAMVADFDGEMLNSLWRVMPAVLALTFVALLILFRSVLIPLKATVLNLLSVLAAYGFLVYLFQDGHGAGLIGLAPPGGLNSFIVLMLFTILFGLSMDYEVFMLIHIADEYKKSGDNTASVAMGLQRTGGLITSAALIMVCLFGSFGFTRLTATREFGLGLAFAVLLDATLIRVLLVPGFMALFGAANWWAPKFLRRRT